MLTRSHWIIQVVSLISKYVILLWPDFISLSDGMKVGNSYSQEVYAIVHALLLFFCSLFELLDTGWHDITSLAVVFTAGKWGTNQNSRRLNIPATHLPRLLCKTATSIRPNSSSKHLQKAASNVCTMYLTHWWNYEIWNCRAGFGFHQQWLSNQCITNSCITFIFRQEDDSCDFKTLMCKMTLSVAERLYASVFMRLDNLVSCPVINS